MLFHVSFIPGRVGQSIASVGGNIVASLHLLFALLCVSYEVICSSYVHLVMRDMRDRVRRVGHCKNVYSK